MGLLRLLIKVLPIAFTIASIITLLTFSWNDLQPQLSANYLVFVNKYTGVTLVLAISLYFVYVDFRHRNIPITINEADILILYEDGVGQNVKIRHKYKFRANHEDIDAIYLYQNPTDCGEIPRGSINASIRGNNYNPSQKTILHKEANKWEIIQSIGSPLPTEIPIIGPLVPRGLEYECEVKFEGCFTNKSYEHYDYAIKHRYAVKKLCLNLYLPESITLLECGLYEKNTASLKIDEVAKVSTSKPGYQKYSISKTVPPGGLPSYRMFWSTN